MNVTIEWPQRNLAFAEMTSLPLTHKRIIHKFSFCLFSRLLTIAFSSYLNFCSLHKKDCLQRERIMEIVVAVLLFREPYQRQENISFHKFSIFFAFYHFSLLSSRAIIVSNGCTFLAVVSSLFMNITKSIIHSIFHACTWRSFQPVPGNVQLQMNHKFLLKIWLALR